jgi:hypothetical protein
MPIGLLLILVVRLADLGHLRLCARRPGEMTIGGS